MTTFQLLTLILGTLGFLLTTAGVIVTITRAVETIKKDTSDKIAAEVLARTEAITSASNQIRHLIEESQKVQDHNFGEVNAAMREKIATVEKKLYEVELYGRDNYVKIPDFKESVDRLGAVINSAVAEIKEDIRRLVQKNPAAH